MDWNQKIILALTYSVFLLGGCSESLPSGAVTVSVIQPINGQRCGYQTAPARLETMTSLATLQGKLGRVVYFPGDLDANPATLASGAGFLSIDTQFLKGSNSYVASDYRTLLGASLYYATEVGYKLHAGLNSKADFVSLDTAFGSRTYLIADAKRSDSVGGPYVLDNAEYDPRQTPDGALLNYLISYPNHEVTGLPLGVNLGIMVHEYTHLVFHNVFYEASFKRHKDITDTVESERNLAAIDEGLADYFGYLATNDPSFFLCSFPGEARDLSVPKVLTSEIRASMKTGDYFDSHEGGAIFAAANYEIGQLVGAQENGRYLGQLMNTLGTCADVQGTNGLRITFEGVAKCHAAVAGSRSADVQAVYSKYLGGGL